MQFRGKGKVNYEYPAALCMCGSELAAGKFNILASWKKSSGECLSAKPRYDLEEKKKQKSSALAISRRHSAMTFSLRSNLSL